jgi:hypothetical protein
VWALGQWGSDWRLAARVHEGFDPRLYLVTPRPGTQKARLYLALPEEVPTFVGEFDIDPEYPHFPYGIEVDPDQDM